MSRRPWVPPGSPSYQVCSEPCPNDAMQRLRSILAVFELCCKGADVRWPKQEELESCDSAIQVLATSIGRRSHRSSLWTCYKAVDRNWVKLRLLKRIEVMLGRASNLLGGPLHLIWELQSDRKIGHLAKRFLIDINRVRRDEISPETIDWLDFEHLFKRVRTGQRNTLLTRLGKNSPASPSVVCWTVALEMYFEQSRFHSKGKEAATLALWVSALGSPVPLKWYKHSIAQPFGEPRPENNERLLKNRREAAAKRSREYRKRKKEKISPQKA